MECKAVRKQLREYAAGEVTDKGVMREMELHIETCVICKRELLLWQELLAKQDKMNILAGHIPKELKDRIKSRQQKDDDEKMLPPAARRIKAMEKIWTSTKGRLLIEIMIVLAGFLWLMMVMRKGTNPLSVALIIIGFASLFFLVLKKKK